MIKNKLNAYANLIDLLTSAEEELGLQNLTNVDKIILKELIKNSDTNFEVKFTYKKLEESISKNKLSVSRSQFFKSISRLIEEKIICKDGLNRSSTFKFIITI